jgi:nitroreductase
MVDIFETIGSRTMVREFSDKQVNEEERAKIIESGLRAPTASGSEQWFFVTVDSEEKREKLYKLLVDSPRIYYCEMLKRPLPKEKMDQWLVKAGTGAFKAPFYLMAFVDLRKTSCTRDRLEAFWAHQSIAAAMENMLLTAWGMGIGGCWFGVPLLMEDEFYSLAGIDKREMQLAGVLGFGYPKNPLPPRKRSKGLKDVVKSI